MIYTTPIKEYDYGDLIPVDEFREMVNFGALIDYDGFGHAVRNEYCDDSMERNILPSKLWAIPRDATHILWFNR